MGKRTWVFSLLLNFTAKNPHVGHVRWGSWLLKMSECIHFSFSTFFIFAKVHFGFHPFLTLSFLNLVLPILVQVCTKMGMCVAHISWNVVFCLWFCLCGVVVFFQKALAQHNFWGKLFSRVLGFLCSIFSNIVPGWVSDCCAIFRDVQVMEGFWDGVSYRSSKIQNYISSHSE